jgi:DNA-directed RNA polymerase specialized sigma24 family protein
MAETKIAISLRRPFASTRGVAGHCTGHRRSAAAEDVLQQAILNLYQHRERYDWSAAGWD